MTSTGQGTDLAGTIGRSIRRARLERGWKQRELARAFGETATPQQISDWERGAVRPSDESLIRLVEVLGHNIAWFVTDHGDEPVAA